MATSASPGDTLSDRKVGCSQFVLARAKQLNEAFFYEDLEGPFKYGTLRNMMSKLTKKGRVLRFKEENPTRFILVEWAHRPEYRFARASDSNGKAGRIDLLSFLESLSWDPILSVHALKLSFRVHSLAWLGSGWNYTKRSHSFRRRFRLSRPVSVQCFDTGTVLVSLGCSVNPFHLNPDGILSLACLLGEVRATLGVPFVPDPAGWIVVQWHLNRDSEKIQWGDLAFSVTFRDFLHCVARVYFKKDISRVRVEASESPQRVFRDIFENVLNRAQSPTYGSLSGMYVAASPKDWCNIQWLW